MAPKHKVEVWVVWTGNELSLPVPNPNLHTFNGMVPSGGEPIIHCLLSLFKGCNSRTSLPHELSQFRSAAEVGQESVNPELFNAPKLVKIQLQDFNKHTLGVSQFTCFDWTVDYGEMSGSVDFG